MTDQRAAQGIHEPLPRPHSPKLSFVSMQTFIHVGLKKTSTFTMAQQVCAFLPPPGVERAFRLFFTSFCHLSFHHLGDLRCRGDRETEKQVESRSANGPAFYRSSILTNVCLGSGGFHLTVSVGTQPLNMVPQDPAWVTQAKISRVSAR